MSLFCFRASTCLSCSAVPSLIMRNFLHLRSSKARCCLTQCHTRGQIWLLLTKSCLSFFLLVSSSTNYVLLPFISLFKTPLSSWNRLKPCIPECSDTVNIGNKRSVFQIEINQNWYLKSLVEHCTYRLTKQRHCKSRLIWRAISATIYLIHPFTL